MDDRMQLGGSMGFGETFSEQAVRELRSVAAFIDRHAEQIIGDIDNVYILDDGIHVEFDVVQHDSISTVRVSKEFIPIEK